MTPTTDGSAPTPDTIVAVSRRRPDGWGDCAKLKTTMGDWWEKGFPLADLLPPQENP